MGLRPWNVFKKTLYAAKPDAISGRVPVTTQISLARARLLNEEAKQDRGFVQHAQVLLPSAAAAWLLLLLAHRHSSDPERLQRLEQRSGGAIVLDFLGWRFLAHLGPYQIPNFVQAKMQEAPLRLLSEPLLLDTERAQALSRLSKMTQRSAAALRLAPPGAEGILALEPLLQEAFGQRRKEYLNTEALGVAAEMAASNQAHTVLVILDVVSATPPEERPVPAWVLSGLVAADGPPWSDGPQGEELRANLLLQLLKTPSNCVAAAALPEVMSYLRQPGMKAKGETLFPIRAYLLSGETPDLLRRGLRLVSKQCPEAVPELPTKRPRDTPSLQSKHDLRQVWTTALLSMAWSSFRAWRGVLDLKSVFIMARACGGGLLGVGALEALWRVEERVIESDWYFTELGPMLVCSAGMCVTNSLAVAWALRFSAVAPFAVSRMIKDPFLDAQRTYEP